MKKQPIFVILLLLLLLSNVTFAQNVTISSPHKPQPIPSKPSLGIKLAAEKSGERVYYTTTQWSQLSNIKKTEINKIGVLLTQGKENFLISLNELPNWVDWNTAQIISANQMPSKAQWQIIKQNKNKINDALTIFGGGNINKRRWWNSGEICSWTVMLYDGTEYDNASPRDDKAGVWLATNDIENGFNEVIVHKADDEEYDYVGSGPSWEGHDCLQIVGLRNKYGFVDTTGKVVIPIKFDDVDGGSPKKEYNNNWSGDGLMSVCINSKWGYINGNGKVVVPIVYDKVDSRCYVPSDNFHPGITRVWKDGLVGGINHIGEFLLSLEYDEIEDYYKKDLFFVKKDNKYGFFNTKYQLIIPFKYDFTSGFNGKEELCAVGINGKYGYIDKSGNEVIPLAYDFAAPFYNGLAAVVKNNKLGYINHSGEIVIPLKYEVEYTSYQYDNFTKECRKDISLGCDFEYSPYITFVKSSNGKFGIINRNGELIVDYIYDDIRSAGTDGFKCIVNGNPVYIDIAGNEYQTEEARSEKSTEKMANQGYVNAQLRLGRKYLSARNYELAHEWLLKAVAQGSIDAVKEIADGYEKRGEYKLAYDWYLKAVESGDIESLLDIGDLFFYKKGLEVSYSKATEWYLKYLESSDRLEFNNNSHCFYNLGYMHYYGGNGIQVSYAKALDYFEKSIAHDAKYFIGWMYEHGQGVDKNSIKAIEYYKACKGKRDSEARIKALENH
ncbi:MAG: SEL1-like repeat protein [Lentimicrobiaceae bacterium]|nr:SEL1-like repeat protein [Lentimicrobiaceae bacterium]